MTNFTNPELIRCLACPDCGGDLVEAENSLECARCNRTYRIRHGIPLLYPEHLDLERLREEENLAKMMRRPRRSRKERFSSVQWERSKEEFWRIVSGSIEPPPRSLVNIGCGYDASFTLFEKRGYLFVNFDIVYDMLYTLRKGSGAAACVAGDINHLPFRKGFFDYVVCIDVIHHESDKLAILLESFRNLLKPGGVLFLEDLNAWGLFQLPKSLLLPKPLHRFLRSAYHRVKHSAHKPADYEFPTNLWRVKRILTGLGFGDITLYPNDAYPNIGPTSFQVYRFLRGIQWVRTYQNYHYILSAEKLAC